MSRPHASTARQLHAERVPCSNIGSNVQRLNMRMGSVPERTRRGIQDKEPSARADNSEPISGGSQPRMRPEQRGRSAC